MGLIYIVTNKLKGYRCGYAERKYKMGKHLSEVVNGKRKSYKGYRAKCSDGGK